MKRSKSLHLGLMLASMPLVLVACKPEPEPSSGLVLASKADCTAQTDVSPAECEKAYDWAVSSHSAAAPKFANRDDCDRQFEKCEETKDAQGQSSFMPGMNGFLMGYLIASAMGPRSLAGASPLYRDRSGAFYKPDGTNLGNRPGRMFGAAGNAAIPSKAQAISRGGFGSRTASGRSTGTGSRSFGG